MTAMTWLRGITPAQRRWTALAALVLIMGVLSWLLVVQGHASVSGGLTGSTFESADGNLASNGAADWNQPLQAIDCGPAVTTTTPAPGVNCGQDLTKSTSDNAFGQGAKEDIPNPSVVAGSIPPNKSDLTRFYVDTETTTGTGAAKYLYLAWERSNVLGNANMDFEFNQSKVLDGNGVTNRRTAGDMLITFDFVNGGGSPDLGMLRWVTDTATVGTCFSSNGVPCWGGRVDLTLAGFANGAVNTTTAHDANAPPATGTDLPALTFGEAGINLSLAGVFPNNTCVNFGDAFLKSRSSASFTAEMKDFIAPIPVQISNCGTLVVHKYIDANANGHNDGTPTDTVTGSPVAGWSFAVTGPGATTTVVCAGTTGNDGNLACSSGTPGDLAKLLPGTYTITETQQSGYYSTDPGTAAITKTASVTLGNTTTVEFGNECFIAKTFQINNVPAGSSIQIEYSVNGGATNTVTATVSSGTATWSVTNTFVQTDRITWDWYANNNSANKVPGATNELLSDQPGGTFSACSVSNIVSFPSVTIHGSKYKDGNANGTKDPGEGPLAGFKFVLLQGGTQIGVTATSAGDGTFSFGTLNVAPGTYTVREVVPAGLGKWVTTDPASGERTITVNLGDTDATVPAFGNTPLSDIGVTFTADTNPAATKSAIACFQVNGDGTTATVGTGSAGTYGATNLRVGSYTCNVVITDP